MTHAQAAERCAQLNREEQGERHWFVRQSGPETWELVSVTAPGLRPQGPLKESVESRPRPPESPDPRPAIIRNIPPFGPG